MGRVHIGDTMNGGRDCVKGGSSSRSRERVAIANAQMNLRFVDEFLANAEPGKANADLINANYYVGRALLIVAGKVA